MTIVTPDEIMKEFTQFLKKTRLDELENTLKKKESIIMKQIKKLVRDSE